MIKKDWIAVLFCWISLWVSGAIFVSMRYSESDPIWNWLAPIFGVAVAVALFGALFICMLIDDAPKKRYK